MRKEVSSNFDHISSSLALFWNGSTPGQFLLELVLVYLVIDVLSVTRRRGIDARRKFVAPVGAWFSQVGRLHEVHHMWQYPYV
jgi:hypothetical protein